LLTEPETDQIFPAEKRHETEQILKEDLSVPYQLSLYSGVQHGFAVRADLSKRETKYAKEQAFLQAVYWFNEYLHA
jgi:dienelactone hydrolase